MGAIGAGFPAERIHRILSETRSVDVALQMARPGDLVLVFPTAVDTVWKQVTTFQPEPSGPSVTFAQGGSAHV
jgi:cyanophycin synthetase